MADETLRGWGIAIERKDGSRFLACSSPGILPAIWPHSQRRFAVKHKRELIVAGFSAKVVPITYSSPAIAEP